MANCGVVYMTLKVINVHKCKLGAIMMLLLSLFMVLQAPAAVPPRRDAPKSVGTRLSQIRVGRAIASQNCQSCHAIGRSGASPNSAAPKFRYLSRKYPVDNLSEAFAEGVLIGHSVMPQFEFAPDQVEALIAYIKIVQVAPPRKCKN
jgi:cytochrome c